MQIPPRIRILGTIETGSVYYFQEELLSSAESHFFVVLNKNPRTEEVLILVCASSQVGKRKRIAEKLKFPKETLVIVSPAEYAIFSRETIIDCNTVFEKTAQSLIEKLEQEKLIVCKGTIPPSVIQKLIVGVLASTQVAEKTKRMLR